MLYLTLAILIVVVVFISWNVASFGLVFALNGLNKSKVPVVESADWLTNKPIKLNGGGYGEQDK